MFTWVKNKHKIWTIWAKESVVFSSERKGLMLEEGKDNIHLTGIWNKYMDKRG